MASSGRLNASRTSSSSSSVGSCRPIHANPREPGCAAILRSGRCIGCRAVPSYQAASTIIACLDASPVLVQRAPGGWTSGSSSHGGIDGADSLNACVRLGAQPRSPSPLVPRRLLPQPLVVVARPVLDEPANDHSSDAGGDENHPDGGAGVAEHVSNGNLLSVVDCHGDDRDDDQRSDDPTHGTAA